VGWTAEKEKGVTPEEKKELMSVGAIIVADIEQLLATTSSVIRMKFTHGVVLELGGTEEAPTRSVEVLLSFVITDLGGSDEKQIEVFIYERLLEIFKGVSMSKYKAQWSFEVTAEKEN